MSCRLHVGIASALEFFQGEMFLILEGTPAQASRIDDVLVFGKNKSEHDHYLRKLLHRLLQAGITHNAEKCDTYDNTFWTHRVSLPIVREQQP